MFLAVFRSGGRRRAAVLTAAVGAGIIVPAQPAQAVNWIPAAAFATCVTDVPVFAARDNGELWLYPHQGTRSGKPTWGQARQVGSGWNGRTMAGPSGQVYSVETGGALKRFAWNGTGWDNGTGSLLAQGWERFATTARDLVTVDAVGDIYRVDADGTLRRFAHDGAKWTVDGQELAKGWDRYTDEYGTFQIRDSLFAGPGGFLHFESAWQVTPDGLRLTTIIPKG
ncbi:tachylectin [Lentzea atacamensis]|uniref:Tachylectin n=1 Tax=Lentzea atacamensis TaxID=531938 RepID=A0ABX9EDX3_9PSEU|nr:tachylectin [Lentzea atacamensis]